MPRRRKEENEEIEVNVEVEAPKVSANKVNLTVWSIISGIRWDRLAGFKHFVKSKGWTEKTIDEWNEALGEFNNREVG